MFRLLIRDASENNKGVGSDYIGSHLISVNCDWVCENRWNKTQEECNSIRDNLSAQRHAWGKTELYGDWQWICAYDGSVEQGKPSMSLEELNV